MPQSLDSLLPKMRATVLTKRPPPMLWTPLPQVRSDGAITGGCKRGLSLLLRPAAATFCSKQRTRRTDNDLFVVLFRCLPWPYRGCLLVVAICRRWDVCTAKRQVFPLLPAVLLLLQDSQGVSGAQRSRFHQSEPGAPPASNRTWLGTSHARNVLCSRASTVLKAMLRTQGGGR